MKINKEKLTWIIQIFVVAYFLHQSWFTNKINEEKQDELLTSALSIGWKFKGLYVVWCKYYKI